jgi:hypothetical protein
VPQPHTRSTLYVVLVYPSCTPRMIRSKQAEVAGPYRRRPAHHVVRYWAALALLLSTKSAPRGQKGPGAVASMMDRARAEPSPGPRRRSAASDGNRGSRHDGAHGAPGQFPGVARFSVPWPAFSRPAWVSHLKICNLVATAVGERGHGGKKNVGRRIGGRRWCLR